MQKRDFLLFLLVAIPLLFFSWKENKKSEFMMNVLESTFVADSLVINDTHAGEQIAVITRSDWFFHQMADVYKQYYNLLWSERKLLKGDPQFEIIYFREDETLFSLHIYEVEEEHLSLLPPGEITDAGVVNYSYSLEHGSTYIFALEEINQILLVNEGLETILEIALSN